MGVTDGLTELAAAQAATRNGANRNASSDLEVMFDPKGKLLLPENPASDDTAGLCKWLTCVFNLDHTHPVTEGTRLGVRGPDGQAVLDRRDAPSLRFEPVRVLNNPTRLIEALSWQKLTSDGTIHGLKADHCRLISHVVVMLCGAHQGMTEAQETEGIVGDLVQTGIAVDNHTTYGHGGQSYEAAVALRRELDETTGRRTGPPRYLVDLNTGEYVIASSDLTDAAKRHIGSSLPRGWLEGRMDGLGWTRITIDGHATPGRAGRQGPHATVIAYRGHLTTQPNQA